MSSIWNDIENLKERGYTFTVTNNVTLAEGPWAASFTTPTPLKDGKRVIRGASDSLIGAAEAAFARLLRLDRAAKQASGAKNASV